MLAYGEGMPVEYDEELVEELRRVFAKLESKVRLLFFTDPSAECVYCEDIEQILELLSATSGGRVEVSRHTRGSEEAMKYNIDLYPAILIHGVDEWNIRYFGIPAGHEFGALVEDVLDASTGRPEVSPAVASALKQYVRRPTRIMVFVTPTCPYCPLAVRTAHKFAMINKNIYGDMIEAIEFSDLADRYGVYAVPKIVIQVDGRDAVEFEGAAPDPYFAAKVLEAHSVEAPAELLRELEYL
jgi:glutaredoxin-like protein